MINDLISRLEVAKSFPTGGVNITDSTVSEIRLLALDSLSEIRQLQSELRDCRNELCLRCGNYKQAHKGACDGCRWKEVSIT